MPWALASLAYPHLPIANKKQRTTGGFCQGAADAATATHIDDISRSELASHALRAVPWYLFIFREASWPGPVDLPGLKQLLLKAKLFRGDHALIRAEIA
jgi:hypothetical protein